MFVTAPALRPLSTAILSLCSPASHPCITVDLKSAESFEGNADNHLEVIYIKSFVKHVKLFVKSPVKYVICAPYGRILRTLARRDDDQDLIKVKGLRL